VDALLILFEALPAPDQDAAFRRLSLARVRHQASTESETGRMLRSLTRVGEVVGRMPPTSTQYAQCSAKLIAAGEDIVPFTRLYNHFGRAWANVVEAVGLSEATTEQGIEARFAARRLGKVARYTDAAHADALERCSTYFAFRTGLPAGERYAPLHSEYEWWRERELELARARGENDVRLPSTSAFVRHGTWDRTLERFGFTPPQIAQRLDRFPPPPRRTVEKNVAMPAGLPIAVLTDTTPTDVDAEVARRVSDIYDSLTPRSRHILTVRLGLAGAPRRKLREAAHELDLHITGVHNAQAKALTKLAAVMPPQPYGDPRTRAGELLQRLADRVQSS
jgi:hypothetical protein